MKWPSFDVRIRDFEMEQILIACDVFLAAFFPLCALAVTLKHNTLQRTIVAKTKKMQNFSVAKMSTFINTFFG